MKVLLVSPQMENPNGGIAVWTDTYLNNCAGVGLDCDLLNTAPMGKRAENGNAKRNFFVEIKRSRGIFRNLSKLLKGAKYDVAHLNTSCGTFGIIRDYLTAKKIKKFDKSIKLLVHFHCDVPVQITNSISKLYLKKLLKLSDANLVLCENSKKYLSNEFDSESEKIPNFINENLLVSKKDISPEIKKVLFVGRVSEEKGAFEAFKVASAFPEITFEFVGAYSDDVIETNLPLNVHLLGTMPHEKVVSKLDESDLFLFPSHSEGFSIALMEAMARGVPVISTDVGANQDMLEEKGGKVVSVGDVEAMCQAIQHMHSPEVRKRMSEWVVNKIKDKYVTGVVMDLLARAYQK